jgi:hypothetical protein
MNSDFSDLLQYFNEEKVEYLIVGGYAVIAYSEPRYTKDLDLWIWATPQNAERVYRALRRFKAPIGEMTPADFEEEGYVFQIGVSPIRIDILMSIDGVDFDEAWNNRVKMNFGGVEAWIIGKNDLIRNKKASGRAQDLLDVQSLEQE